LPMITPAAMRAVDEDRCLAIGSEPRRAWRGAPPCTSPIRALLDFSIARHPAHNFLAKRLCCRFAQVIGITRRANRASRQLVWDTPQSVLFRILAAIFSWTSRGRPAAGRSRSRRAAHPE
jgi:hypothetical protein